MMMQNHVWQFLQTRQVEDGLNIDSYVASRTSLSLDDLAAIARLDMRHRWSLGEFVQAEWYFQRFAELAGNPAERVELIYTEYILSEKHGDLPHIEEYCDRFPECAADLREQVAFHQALITDADGPTGSSSPVVWSAAGDAMADTVEGSTEDAATVGNREPGDVHRPDNLVADRHLRRPGYPEIPNYTIEAEIGRGGVGVVYKAFDHRLRRMVALKMLLAGEFAQQQQLRRFQTEAEAIARLDHPGIVHIYEIGRQGELLYLTLEYVDGCSLARFCAGRPQAARWSARLVAQLAQTMDSVHQKGIVHRDLKPGNILLAGVDPDLGSRASALAVEPESPEAIDHKGATPQRASVPLVDADPHKAKIVDFGMAKLKFTDATQAGGAVTHSGEVLGTPQYMAPEQVTGHTLDVGPSADIHALGAMLYELLTGRPPFADTTAMGTLRQVTTKDPVAPSRLVDGVPGDLETICLKCLRKDPAGRYKTAADLAEDLDRFLKYRPIMARRASVLERTVAWARRNPLAAALSTLMIILINGGLIAVTSLYLHAREQSLEADRNFQYALDTVEKYLIQVSENPELKSHGLEKLRTDRLTTAELFFREFARKHSTDPGLQARLANAHFRLAKIHRELGDREASIEQYQRMYTVASSLALAEPLDISHLRSMAVSRQNQAAVYKEMGRYMDAEQSYLEAMSLLEEVARKSPGPLAVLDLAMVNYELSHLYSTLDRDQDERRTFDAAQTMCHQLEPVIPQLANQETGKRLSQCFEHLGKGLARSGKLPEAEAQFQLAFDIGAQLIDQQPNSPECLLVLSRSASNVAVLRLWQGKIQAAREAFARAHQHLRRLVESHPLVDEYRASLATNLLNSGALENDAQQWKEADSHWRQALQLFERLSMEQPENVEYQLVAAQLYSNLGNTRYARGQYKRAESLYQTAIDRLSRLAAEHAENVEVHQWLAALQNNLANVFNATNRYAEAAQCYAVAATIFERLQVQHRGVPEYRKMLSIAHTNRASACRKLSNLAEAEAEILKSRAILEELVDGDPASTDYLNLLGDCWLELGSILYEESRLGESENACLESLRVRDELLRLTEIPVRQHARRADVLFQLSQVAHERGAYDEMLTWITEAQQIRATRLEQASTAESEELQGMQQALSDACREHARALLQLNRFDEALAECERGSALSSETKARGIRLLRARIHARQGLIDGVIPDLDALVSSNDLTARETIDAAAILALAAGAMKDSTKAEEYANQSIHLLQSLRDEKAQRLRLVGKDPDFTALRHRKAFQELIQKIVGTP